MELNVKREGLNDHWDSNQSIKKNKTYLLCLSLTLNSLPLSSTKGSATNDWLSSEYKNTSPYFVLLVERFSPAGNSRISYKTKQWYRTKGTRNDTLVSANKDLVISRVCSVLWHLHENSNLHRGALSKRKYDIIR